MFLVFYSQQMHGYYLTPQGEPVMIAMQQQPPQMMQSDPSAFLTRSVGGTKSAKLSSSTDYLFIFTYPLLWYAFL